MSLNCLLLKMFYNCQFSFKKVSSPNILFYCFISNFFINFCFCATYDRYLSDFGDEKTVFIDNEEIIRRRSVAENYLKEVGNTQNDWIETYHSSFVESSEILSRKANQEGLLENEDGIHVTLPLLHPFQNVDFSSLENSQDSVNPYESLNRDMSSGNNPEDGPKSFKKATDNILQQSLKSSNDQMCNSNVSKEKSKYNNLEAKKPKKRQTDSKSNKLGNSHHELALKNINGNTYVHSNGEKYNICSIYNKNNKSDSKIKHTNTPKTHDIQLDKFIEIIIMNSELISEKYFINSASLTLTEFQKLQKNLARLSFLQKSKNSVYSVNRMNIIDSMGKLKSSYKQDEFIKEAPQLYKFSNTNDEISIESMQDSLHTIKKSVTDFNKRVSLNINHDENIMPNTVKHSSFLESTSNENFVASSRLESTDKNYFSHDSEIVRRKKLMNSFLVTLNNNQKNWVETYDFNDINSESEENVLHASIKDNFKERKSDYNIHKTSEQPKEFSKTYFHEQSYIIRWINRLSNKVKESQCSYCSHNIFVSGDSLKILGSLSQKFDIVTFDELVSSIISNATMNNNFANMLYFNYESALNAIFMLLNYPIIYIFITLLFSYIFICSLSNTGQNFTMYRIILAFLKHYKWIVLITLLSASLFWNGNKMYQQKIAQKHNVMSRVVPSYCESILHQESGIIAHFKEYFRAWYHNEDCKKYYEAVMVDPSSEISPLSIGADLFYEIILQMLQSFGRNMNSFFKALMYDLSLIQQIFIAILAILFLVAVLCFCFMFLALRWNYKVYFPFHMGSIEPTKFTVGSRVQEIEEKESSYLRDCSISNASQITYINKTDNKNHVEDIILKDDTIIVKSKHFKLNPSKHNCVLKISRTRHNSI